MPEALVETVPFVIGAILGWLTFDDRVLRANAARMAGGSVIAGAVCAAVAGELGHDLASSALALVADSAAVAAGWMGARLALRQARALTRRA
jgi:hypothetical protein